MIANFSGDNEFLSNFFPVHVKLDDLVYPSVENAFQAAKTLHRSERLELVDLTAGQSKRAGRRLILRKDWVAVKVEAMRSLLRQKFAPGTALAQKLVATAPHELVEGNTWGDEFWGICDGVGENHLGRLLMEIRSDLLSF